MARVIKTRITEMLGIQYPILLGAMQGLTTAELVAAVSNAGGLGVMATSSFKNKEELREEIKKCQALTDPVQVIPTPLTVVEGTYAMHPYFRDPYDLRIFLTIDSETQRQRIGLREVWKQERFFREWIPMEQQYFAAFSIQKICDLVL